jgi:hypothetical protein
MHKAYIGVFSLAIKWAYVYTRYAKLQQMYICIPDYTA